MIQDRAFDPGSGAPLSPDKDYPPGARAGRDQGARTPVEHPHAAWTRGREGALTNGELVSSAEGLLGYFRRSHRQVRPPAAGLDCAAALAIKRLKAADDRAMDALVWYALAERLARKGHWTAWMLDHAIPRCPRCRSQLKFRPGVDGLEGVCASAPNRHGAVDGAIREHIRVLYDAAFDESIAAGDLILF
jgi:hypothetical protein